MRLGLRNRVALGFAAGALLLSVLLVSEIYAVSSRFLVEQRDRSATRQAVVNATLLSTRLASGSDPALAAEQLRTGSEVDSLVRYEGAWYSSAVGVGPTDLPATLTATVAGGEPALQRYRTGGGTAIAVGVPLPSGGEYYEVATLEPLGDSLQALRVAGVLGAVVTTLLGAALGFWAAARVLRPLGDVTRAAAQLAGGDLRARVPDTTDPDLAPIAGSFNAMARTLGDRIERDERFAADVSHELRSPLTTMTAGLSVLQARRSELPGPAREATDLIGSDLERFSVLLEDLLDLASDGRVTPVDDLPDVDLAVVAQLVLADRGLSEVPLIIEGRTHVRGDRRRLERIVANVVDNATRHGQGVVGVRVAQSAGLVHLEVDDQGPGIPAAERELVFERFSRGSGARRRGSGTGSGLGLSLVREHAVAHGGAVRIEDRPGGGARFVVELPAAQP